MLRRRGWRVRAWTVLWAVLQFAVPAIVSAADARLEHDGRAQVAHIESGSSSACRPVHEADCALCQLLTHSGGPMAAPGLPAPAASVPSGVAAACLHPAAAWLEHLPSVRAPPVA